MRCVPITTLLAVMEVFTPPAPRAATPGSGGEAARPAPQESAIDGFRKKMQLAERPESLAAIILEIGRLGNGQDEVVAALVPHLSPKPADLYVVVPLASLTALSNFRGSAAASKALIRALPVFEEMPFLLSATWKAIAKVGHPSALALFQAEVQSRDPGRANRGVRRLATLPSPLSLPALFEEHLRLEKRGATAQNAEKSLIAGLQSSILAEVKRISGEVYPSMKEMEIWFKRHGQDFLGQARKAEEQRRGDAEEPGAPPPGLPPLAIVDLTFNDLDGALTSNLGISASLCPRAKFSDPPPAWSANQPTRSGGRAVDFGVEAGPKAVDLIAGRFPHLQGMTSFSITGWISLQVEPGDDEEGRPIVSWLLDGKDGVELVYRRGGALQLGVNERAHRSPAKTMGDLIPSFDKSSGGGLRQRNNWRFFAVTYDQGLPREQVKLYTGSWGGAARLVAACDYDRGPVGQKISPVLSVGNVNLANRPQSPGRSFPGLIDEIRIFGSREMGLGAMTLEGILEIQKGSAPD